MNPRDRSIEPRPPRERPWGTGFASFGSFAISVKGQTVSGRNFMHFIGSARLRPSWFQAFGVLRLLAVCAAMLMGAPILVMAEPSPLRVELNKLEPRGDGCRIYMVFANPSELAFQDFRLDLVFFGRDGVIAKRIAVDAAPLRAAKTIVKLFDVASLPCADIGSVLINDVLSCRNGEAEMPNCIGRIATASRVEAELLK